MPPRKMLTLYSLPGSRKIQHNPAAGSLLFLVCHSIFTVCAPLYHEMYLFLKDLATEQGSEVAPERNLSGLSTSKAHMKLFTLRNQR